MNNNMATTIRNNGVATVFPNGVPSDFIQVDSGKWVFRVGENQWVGMSFTAKVEDYAPDYEVARYAEKVKAAAMRKAELEAKRKAKAEAKAVKAD
jgi:hypothetical protein